MATIGIYQIVNLITQKRYIGMTTSMIRRKAQHLLSLKNNKHANQYLQNSFNKHGEDNFKFICIEECCEDQLYEREHHWVQKMNVLSRDHGYNLALTDPNGKRVWTKEQRKKLSNSHKIKGIGPSEKCIEALKSRHLSDEHKAILAESRKEIDFFEVHKKKRKQVMNTLTGDIYESLRAASEKTGIPKYDVSRKLLGKRKNNTNLIYID